MKPKIIRRLVVVFSIICLFIGGCSQVQAPLEFSPPPEIIKKAIALELQIKYERLSKQLHTTIPQFEITQVNVTKIEPSIKLQKATYDLEGKYQAIVKSSNRKRKKISSHFHVSIQRQLEGKTWKILINEQNNNSNRFSIYKIR